MAITPKLDPDPSTRPKPDPDAPARDPIDISISKAATDQLAESIGSKLELEKMGLLGVMGSNANLEKMGLVDSTERLRQSIGVRDDLLKNLGESFGSKANLEKLGLVDSTLMKNLGIGNDRLGALKEDAARSVHSIPLSIPNPFDHHLTHARAESKRADYRAGMADVMYDALIHRIDELQSQLAPDEEFMVTLANFGSRVAIRVTCISYQPPHLMVFDGFDDEDNMVRLLQHTSQSNLLLVRRTVEEGRAPTRIGFACSTQTLDDPSDDPVRATE